MDENYAFFGASLKNADYFLNEPRADLSSSFMK